MRLILASILSIVLTLALATPANAGPITITSSANPSVVGQSVTFTVTGLHHKQRFYLCEPMCSELFPVDGTVVVTRTFSVKGEYRLAVLRVGAPSGPREVASVIQVVIE